MPKEKEEHLAFQKSYFDKNVDFFKKEIPEDIVSRSRQIVSLILKDKTEKVLDVGTGIGVFLAYYHEFGIAYKNMFGCDLSSEMLNIAKHRFPEVNFWQGDVCDFPGELAPFDLIVFNACFGNIIDQNAVMKKCRSLLRDKGRIAISHPMGNNFVRELKDAEPELVHSLLPARETLNSWAESLNMQIVIFRDEADLYLALLERL